MIRYEFFFIDEDTDTTTSISEPEGVRDLVLNIKRDEDKHGIFFENSLNELTFYGTAAEYLQTIYQQKRINANIRFDIFIYCEPDIELIDAEVPETVSAKIDFKTYRDKCGNDCAVIVGLEQTSCINILQSRIDTKIDLSAANDLAGAALPTTDKIDFNMELPARDLYLTDFAMMPDNDNNGIPDEGINEDLALQPDWFPNVVGGNMTAYLFPGYPLVKDSGLGDFHVSSFPQVINGGFNNRPDPNTMTPTVEFNQPPGIDCEFTEVTVTYNLVGMVTQYESTGSPTTILRLKLFTFLPGGDETDAADYVEHLDILLATMNDTEIAVSINESGTVTIPGVVAGMKLWFGIYIASTETDNVDQFLWYQDAQTDLKIEALISCNSSVHKVSMIHESLSRVAQSITEQCIPYVRSDFYGRPDSSFDTAANDGCGALRVILNGLKLRRATPDAHFISFRELFDWLNAMDNIGMGIETDVDDGEIIRIEDVRYFYQDDFEILSIENIPDAITTLDIKKVYSRISVGYENWKTNFSSGLDEFNTTREYRTAIKYINNELKIISGFVAGSYPIEQARRESFAATGRADTTYDNNTFIICVVRDDDQFAPEYAIITGDNMLPGFLTAVNARITPVRNLMRWHKSIVQSYAQPATNDEQIFAAGTGNYIAKMQITRIECTLEVESYDLSENERIEYELFETAYLGYNEVGTTKEWQPFIQPEVITFDYPLSLKMYKQIKANPYGYILYSCGTDGTPKKGFIKSINFKLSEGMGTFELIPEFVHA